MRQLYKHQVLLEKLHQNVGSQIDFNIKEENHIHKSILFVFPGNRNDANFINYCLVFAKYYIYFEKKIYIIITSGFNVVCLGYLYQLKYIPKIEKKSNCTKTN